MIDKFKDYISSISKQSNVAILHDTDADGMSAMALTNLALKKLNIRIKLTISKHHSGREITNELVNELKQNKITHLICLDLPVESFPGKEKLSDFKVLIIDHHPIELHHIKSNFLIIKPHLFQYEILPFKICTAQVVYLFFSKIMDIEDLKWILLIGMMGDITYDTHKNFMDDILKKLKIIPQENIFDTEFGKLVNYITYADCISTNDSYKKVEQSLLNSNNWKQALENLNEFKIVEDEINNLIKEFDSKKEILNYIYFYEVKSKYNTTSILSTIISIKKIPNNVLLVLEENNNKIHISARCQNQQHNMGKMLSEIKIKLKNASGGGHIPAAGATIQLKDKNKFKEMVIQYIKGE
ncbi:MAG: DHH family phosphoesterase [Candidatus Woesearchaeota archaeon]